MFIICTSCKRDPQRTEKRKEMEQRRQTEKIIDGILMKVNCKLEVQDSDEQPGVQTSTQIEVSNEGESSAAEAQHISNDLQQFEDEVQEAMQEDPDQHNDENTEYSTDADLPPLVERQQNDASSDDNLSNGLSDNHIDHDHSSIKGSDDERSTVPELQERNRSDSSSDRQ